MEWEQQPKYFAEYVGGDADTGTVVLRGERTLPPRPMRIEFETTTGEASAHFDMQPTAPPAGWELALVGHRGGTALQLTFRRRGPGAELNLNWSWRMNASRSAQEHLVGLDMLQAAAGKGEVRLIDVPTGELLSVAASPEVQFDEPLQILKRVLEDLVTLEDWLGLKIDVPEEISPGEANALRRVAKLIEGVEDTWKSANFTLENDPGPEALAEPGIIQQRRSLAVDLFGRRYQVGDEATYITGAKLVSTEPDRGGRKFYLEPATPDAKMLARLERGVQADGADERPAE